MNKKLARLVIEMSFIIFLFYSNLLMGEYTRSGKGSSFGFKWAVKDIFTIENFGIALVSAFIGYIVFELLRNKYK